MTDSASLDIADILEQFLRLVSTTPKLSHKRLQDYLGGQFQPFCLNHTNRK